MLGVTGGCLLRLRLAVTLLHAQRASEFQALVCKFGRVGRSHNQNPAGHLRETRARRRAGITERRAADRTVGTDHADFDAISVAQVHQQQPAALAAEIT
jgi:hypothetical protein